MTIWTAVIGVGAMGRNHARVYSDLPGVDLVGVADLDGNSAAAVVEKFGAQAFADSRNARRPSPGRSEHPVPTVQHHRVAMAVIERGIDLLIEKPISFSIEEGQQLIAAAERCGPS